MKPYIVHYLAPGRDVVLASSTEEAVQRFLVSGRLLKGSIVQGAYPADGPVPEAFGGPPETPPPTPVKPGGKPNGGGQAPGAEVPADPSLIPAVGA